MGARRQDRVAHRARFPRLDAPGPFVGCAPAQRMFRSRELRGERATYGAENPLRSRAGLRQIELIQLQIRLSL